MADLDTDWFTDKLAERQMSQRALARLLGVDHASVYRLLRGKRQMRMDEAARIASLLGVDVSEVLAHTGVRVGPAGDRTVGLMGWVDGDGEVHLYDGERERIPAPPELPEDAMAVRVQAQGGAYQAIDGWVYFTTKPESPTQAILGRLAVVECDRGIQMLRFVRRGYRSGTYNLLASFAGVVAIENAHLEWAAPVLLIRPA